METYKKRRGDRKDGRLLRELDSLHFITGIIYPTGATTRRISPSR